MEFVDLVTARIFVIGLSPEFFAVMAERRIRGDAAMQECLRR
jgi:hypothetical protein